MDWMEVTNILLGRLETIIPVLTVKRDSFDLLEKKILNCVTPLTVFIHVIFHSLCSLPGYLGVILQSHECFLYTVHVGKLLDSNNFAVSL
jgi:hypothetical protein